MSMYSCIVKIMETIFQQYFNLLEDYKVLTVVASEINERI